MSKLSDTYKDLKRQMSEAVKSQCGGDWSNDQEVNDRLWREEARKCLNELWKEGNTAVGQLFAQLSAAAEDKQLKGYAHFVWSMAEYGDTKRSLAESCSVAGLEAPPEATGPLDKLVDRTRAARKRKSFSARFSAFWKDINTPRQERN